MVPMLRTFSTLDWRYSKRHSPWKRLPQREFSQLRSGREAPVTRVAERLPPVVTAANGTVVALKHQFPLDR